MQGERRAPSAGWLASTLIAVVAGGAVDLITSRFIYIGDQLLGFWGAVWGAFAGVLSLALSHRSVRFGRNLSLAAPAILAIGTVWWIVMWGYSPRSLEGLWLYAIVVMALLLMGMVVRRARGAPFRG